jgi:hypothetical protein
MVGQVGAVAVLDWAGRARTIPAFSGNGVPDLLDEARCAKCWMGGTPDALFAARSNPGYNYTPNCRLSVCWNAIVT